MEQKLKNSGENENASCKVKDIIVVMVPLPAQGHLNQLLHFSGVISSYGIPVYYAGTATHNRQAKARIHGWDPITLTNLHFHDFPPPPSEILIEIPNNSNAPHKFPSHIMPVLNSTFELRRPVYEYLKDLATTARKLVVIHDSLMPYVIQDATSIQNVESYCFHSCSAMTIYSFIWETAGKPDIPQAQIFQKGLPTPESMFPPELSEFARLQQESSFINSGNIFNSCREIEGPYFDLLAEAGLTGTDKVWALGPFNPIAVNTEQGKNGSRRHKCLEWLDKQAPHSVMFVAFGSTTTLWDEEIEELAIGLERSEQKFIWVLRDADRGDGLEGKTRRSHQLPEGYEERIEGRGLIIRDWAPQLETLAHPSTGGFMSHCGWNSTIESISMGVPMAAWPMHCDQPRNAILITEHLKIGLNVKDWSKRRPASDESVTSKDIENVVRRLMDSAEGEEIRIRAAELSNAIKKSVQEGGNTRSAMDSFIAHICN